MRFPSVAMIGVLLLVVGWRWYDVGVTMPVRIDRIADPTMVLVVQEGDCPDRRRALETWVRRERNDAVDGIGLAVAALAGPEPSGASAMAGLPVLSESVHTDISRALLRSGVGATPAILLVDENGYPVLAFGFEETGPGPRMRLVSGALSRHATPARSPGFPGSLPPLSRGDESRWNP